MFSNFTNLWDTVKAGVQGQGPESDSENTEGPDSEQPSPTSEHAAGTEAKPVSPTVAADAPQPKEPTPEASPKEEVPSEKETGDGEAPETNEENPHAIPQQLEEVSTKAINTAKEWGNYLYSFGKAASTKVAETAKHVKDAVEEKTILGDFSKEQDKFVTENKDKQKSQDAAVPPWVGYNEEEDMKTQILALSKDKRNFLRNPPAGVQFHFDYHSSSPVATVMLAEDPELEKMRFELVPKQVTEEAFWRNYFYRVSLIKQSAQLTSIAQHTGDSSSSKSRDSSRRSSSDPETKSDAYTRGRYQCYYCEATHPDFQHLMAHLTDAHPAEHSELDPMEMVGQPKTRTDSKDEDLPTASPPDHEFASDAFQDNGLNEEDIRKEMQLMGVMKDNTGGEDDVPEWERELQAELQEYEVVNDGNGMEDEDLEQEIMKQIEAEANQS